MISGHLICSDLRSVILHTSQLIHRRGEDEDQNGWKSIAEGQEILERCGSTIRAVH
jgi:hypothetical protein